MTNTEKHTVAIYDSLGKVEEAISLLTAAGIKRHKISVITQSLETETKIHGFVTRTDAAESGVITGAWTGGLFGLLIGAAFIWAPGIGPLVVAGSLATALLGSLEGAVAGAAGGGLLGTLLGFFVEKSHIPKYEAAVKGGKFLLVINGSTEEVDQALHILEQHGADVSVHTL